MSASSVALALVLLSGFAPAPDPTAAVAAPRAGLVHSVARSTPGYQLPLTPAPVVARPFDPPHTGWGHGHRGVDLAATVGQVVQSAGAGRVTFSAVLAGRGVVTVTHSATLRTTYEPVDRRPRAGEVVARGDPIGVVAATPGHCAPAACLHWGAISAGDYIDPLGLLGGLHPVLLPLDRDGSYASPRVVWNDLSRLSGSAIASRQPP